MNFTNKKFKKIISIIVITLLLSVVLVGCGEKKDNENAGEGETPATNTDTKTSNENKVIYENGEFTLLDESSILITSIGQSADISMLDALAKKTTAKYTLDQTADAEDVKEYETIIITAGASSKGLGAAGISAEDELTRAQEIIKVIEEDDSKKVILVHIGGQSRRGTLSDQFIDILFDVSDYMIVVEEGNSGGLFTDYAASNNIPIALLHNISDTLVPLQVLFDK